MGRLWGWLRWLFMILFFLAGLWVVVVNRQDVGINLIFWQVPPINEGLALVLSFLLGSVVGMLMGLNLYLFFKLKGQVWWLRRQVQQMHQDLAGKGS